MEIINSNTNNVNGSSLSHIIIKNELTDINHSLNLQNREENSGKEKNKLYLPLPFIEFISSKNEQNKNQNLILSNALSEKKSGFLNNSIRKEELKKQKRNISNETLENGLNLDEQNLKEYYERIEKELNKLKNDNNNKYIKKNENEENKNLNIKNKYSFSNNNIINQFDGDLFYYSDEENNNKKKNDNKENKQIQTDKIIDHITINDKTEIKDDDKIKNNNNSKKLDDIFIDRELLDTIEYGIDENGNPIDIKNFFQENNNKDNYNKIKKTKKPVAFIIQREEKGKNYLIDLKGNEIPKMKDGYFNFKNDNIRLLIKDFDVQHPELRVFGARKRDDLILNDEDENMDKDKDINIDNNKSIEIKQLFIPNNLKNKIMNRNMSFNSDKSKNIIIDNYFGQKRLFLKQYLLNSKRTSPIIIKKNIENDIKKHKDKQFHEWTIKEKPKLKIGKHIIITEIEKIFFV